MKFILDDQQDWCYNCLDYLSRVRIDRDTDIISTLFRISGRLEESLKRLL